jgi:signal transduction histidine kinase
MDIEDSYPQLISLAVHEFRTPASVVGGYLRMLQRDAQPLGDRHRKMIDEAEKSCARLVGLIAELGEIAKLDDGSAVLASLETDLFDLVANVAKGMHEFDDRGLRLEARGASAGAVVEGDPDRLRGAFSGIFRAILREQVEPSLVIVDRRIVEEDGASSAVIVIAEESRVQTAYDAPIEPFDEKRGGVGLSLPLARRVILAHGGRLWAPDFGDARAARRAALIVFPLRS